MRSESLEEFRVVVQVAAGPLRSAVERALSHEGIAVRDPEGGPGAAPEFQPDLLILDGQEDVSGVLREGTRQGWLAPTTPVVVLGESPVPRERLVAWLRAGVWEVVRVPLDEELFALQVRNILRSRGAATDRGGTEPYSRGALLMVTEECLALARRFGRPLSVAALCPDWGPQRREEPGQALLRRLAAAAAERTRRSDLIGATAGGALLILLPDSDQADARILLDRMHDYLSGQLREWGVAARLRTGLLAVDAGDPPDAESLLAAAEVSLTAEGPR